MVRELLKRFRNSETKSVMSPVEKELRDLDAFISSVGVVDAHKRYDYEMNLQLYLEFAVKCGLSSKYVLLSCKDLAMTLITTPSLSWENTSKNMMWKSTQSKYLEKGRSQRSLNMKLYPSYFAAILGGDKTWEGRAYDPESDKEYPDLREGDVIDFTIDQEADDWENRCRELNIHPSSIMRTNVGKVEFSPTVHGMYQFHPAVGEEFQPMIEGVSELLYLQRAAVYYSFPNYKERIDENGFIGIEMVRPRLITQSLIKSVEVL